MADIRALIKKTEQHAQYDEYAKQILARKVFLANILVLTVEEFYGMDPKEVERLIEGEPSVSATPVDEGFTNDVDSDGKPVIRGMNSESRIADEGVTYYDIIFWVLAPGGKRKIIINMEAQKSLPSSYHVENRGIVYGARSISAQVGRDFGNQEYDKVQKVYSIWICMNCDMDKAYLIHFTKKDLIGRTELDFDYRLLNVLIVQLTEELAEKEWRLHRLLGTLFLPFDNEEKDRILQEEYGVELDEVGKEMMGEVCNLSLGIEEAGMRKGMREGMAKINKLFLLLLEQGRKEDMVLAVQDQEYQKKLLEEFGI